MGFFDKLLFWKKDGLPDLPEDRPLGGLAPPMERPSDLGPPRMEQPPDLGPLPSMPGAPQPDFNEPVLSSRPPGESEPPMRRFDRPQAFDEMAPQPQSRSADRSDLIVEKLDTIKAQLDSVLQRLDRIDRSREYQQRWR